MTQQELFEENKALRELVASLTDKLKTVKDKLRSFEHQAFLEANK